MSKVARARDIFLRENREGIGKVFLESGELGAARSGSSSDRQVDVEYCVNTVSLAGRHYVSDIIKVYRRRVGRWDSVRPSSG